MKTPPQLLSISLNEKKFQWLLLALAVVSVFVLSGWLSVVLKLVHHWATNWFLLVFYSVTLVVLIQLWIWFLNLIQSGSGRLVLRGKVLSDHLSYYRLREIELRFVERAELLSFLGVPFLYIGIRPSVWKNHQLTLVREFYRLLFMDEIWMPVFFLQGSWSQIHDFVHQLRQAVKLEVGRSEPHPQKSNPPKPSGPPKLKNQALEETKTSFLFKFSRVLELPPALPTEFVAESTFVSASTLSERFQWLCDLYIDNIQYFEKWKREESPRLPRQVQVLASDQVDEVAFEFGGQRFQFRFRPVPGSDETPRFKFEILSAGHRCFELLTQRDIGLIEPIELLLLEGEAWVDSMKELRTILVSPLSQLQAAQKDPDKENP